MAEPDIEVEDDLAESFWAVARRLRQLNREALAPWDITPSQLRGLSTVLRHGTMRPSDLAERLRIAPRSATELVDGLQEHGFVRRQPDPHDRRATLIALTDRGRELATALRASRAARAESFFNQLDAADRATLARIMRSLRGAADQDPAVTRG